MREVIGRYWSKPNPAQIQTLPSWHVANKDSKWETLLSFQRQSQQCRVTWFRSKCMCVTPAKVSLSVNVSEGLNASTVTQPAPKLPPLGTWMLVQLRVHTQKFLHFDPKHTGTLNRQGCFSFGTSCVEDCNLPRVYAAYGIQKKRKMQWEEYNMNNSNKLGVMRAEHTFLTANSWDWFHMFLPCTCHWYITYVSSCGWVSKLVLPFARRTLRASPMIPASPSASALVIRNADANPGTTPSGLC